MIIILENSHIKWPCRLTSAKCLHHLTYAPPEIVALARQNQTTILPEVVIGSVQRTIIRLIQQPIPSNKAFPMHCYLKTISSSLSILFNLVICAPKNILGNIIISTCRPFVFHGLPGVSHEDLVQENIEKLIDMTVSSEMDSDAASRVFIIFQNIFLSYNQSYRNCKLTFLFNQSINIC